jgi:drug/metabolite transporter (DMT)-like permease
VVSIGIIYALIAMVSWSISDLTIKPLAKKFGTLNATIYKFLPHLVFLFIYFLIKGFFIPTDPLVWFLLLIFGIFGAIALLAFVKSIETGLISINLAIAHASVIVTAILSAIFFGEILNFYQYLIIILILFGITLLSFDQKSLLKFNFKKFNAGAKYAFITVLGWGIIYAIIKPIALKIGPYASVFYPDLFVISIVFFIFLKKGLDRKEIITKVLTKKTLLLILLASITSFSAVIFTVKSILVLKVALTFGIITAAPIVTTVLAMIFFKEKITKLQGFAILFVMVNIIILTIIGG